MHAQLPHDGPVSREFAEVDVREQLAAHGGLVVPHDLGPLLSGYQGWYSSETAYFRQALEPFVEPCVGWLLDCVDWGLVRAHLGEHWSLPLRDGSVLVFRVMRPREG